MYRRFLEAELELALNAIILDTELYVRDDDEEIVDAMDNTPHGDLDDINTNTENYYRRRQLINQVIEDINHQIDTMSHLGASDIDPRLEEILLNGIQYVFQEQTSDDDDVNEFGATIKSLGLRVKPLLPQISEEEQLMGHFRGVLYEYLGEEDPEVSGSVLGAFKAIVSVIDLTKMIPSVDHLLSRVSPIFKNRHEKVEKNCIELVGCITTRGAEYVSERECMLICDRLHEMLNAPQDMEIRWAAVKTFEYITEAIGPQKVLDSFLFSLKVRQSGKITGKYPTRFGLVLRMLLWLAYPVFV
ncbi:splicing factor 3B subunit 1 [Tanacetum coccineum]